MFRPEAVSSITDFRQRVRSCLANERASDRPRPIVILAIDGVPWNLARRYWRHAEMEPMRSVFPTTSSAAWLSSLTGCSVDEHGIPGVVFMDDDAKLINVYQFHGAMRGPDCGNIFSDARTFGFHPVAVLGDWVDVPCSWRDTLVRGAHTLGNQRFYSASPMENVDGILRAALEAIDQAVSMIANVPSLVWCFLELDRHVHAHGYNDEALEFLGRTDELAASLMKRHNCLVLAHSDHGLVPTSTSPLVASTVEDFQQRHGCELGGAGRARWIYASKERTPMLIAELRTALAGTVDVVGADQIFAAGSLARQRVGSIVLIAREHEFLSFSGLQYDHGSLTTEELFVPFARWGMTT